MESNEKYRGQKDGIILFILSKGERHADELKIIIDNYFSGVKIGTLYSIIARLKNQNYLTEYRASSIDGSRRKYFKLTDKGLKAYTENYAQLFIDCNVELTKKDYSSSIEEEIKVEKPANETVAPILEEPNIDATTEKNDSATIYSNMINDDVLNNDFSGDIDFSSVENNETTTEVINTQPKTETKSDFIPYDYDTNFPAVPEVKEENQDSILNSKYEYSSILGKMFPKKKKQEINDVEEVETNDISNDGSVKEFSESQTDWNEVYDMAEKEGIKIRTSSDTNRYQGSKILLSKLLLCSTAITLGLAIIEYLLLTLLIPNVPFNLQAFITVVAIFGSFTVVALINFLINPFMQVKNLPRFINVIEICLILTISTAIIAFSVAVIKEVNFSNNAEIFSSIILPILLAFDLIVLSVITYLLAKTDHFESL